jgi:mediator of RNA polymerase II transcription subunit 31
MESPPTRFEIELEFIQSLANPQYLNFLAQNKYLESEEFVNYLEYLEYWRQPKYSKYLIYPNCLHVLSLLKEPQFRQEISRPDVAKMFMDEFYMKWLEGSGVQLGNGDAVNQEGKMDSISLSGQIKVEKD